MATKIEQYNAAKNSQIDCLNWVALIGSSYSGGGGGIGKLQSLQLAKGDAAPTVYHQYSDSAKNYHTMQPALAWHLDEAIKARFGELVADAMARQDVALKAIAAEAVKEHCELLQAAGLAA